MTLAHPWLMTISLLLTLAAVAWVARRRGVRPRGSVALVGASIVLLCFALGAPSLQLPRAGDVVVLVDLSPSTRGATYRDRQALQQRLRQLLGSTRYHLHAFSDVTTNLPDAPTLPDLPVDQTLLNIPPNAGAVVLFSDGQFPAPGAAVPVFPVLDPALARASDASVDRLELRDTDQTLATTFNNTSDASRDASLSHVTPGSGASVPTGRTVVTRRVLPAPGVVSVTLAPGDAWPENDALSLELAEPRATQRWWVSTGPSTPAPPGAWRRFAPGDLPASPLAWLGASVVVIDNVPANQLSPVAQQNLIQYVRDLGGALILSGTDGAFSDGAWTGSALDTLSPLASTPPDPVTHWMILVDASGSMAEPVTNDPSRRTRWQLATRAALDVLPALPPADALSIGSFNRDLTWWSTGRSVAQTRDVSNDLPPRAISPSGPTNLQPVLERLATSATNVTSATDATSATNSTSASALLISDGQATVTDVDALSRRLVSVGLRLHVLHIGSDTAPDALSILARQTGGALIRSTDAAQWTTSARELARQATPSQVQTTAMTLRWTSPALPDLVSRDVTPWSRTWLRDGATPLATAQTDGRAQTPVARWRYGAGSVTAVAFSPTPVELMQLTRAFAGAPRDPRLRVSFTAADTLRVLVDASDTTGYLNGLRLSITLRPIGRASTDDVRSFPLPQTAPGRYELTLPAPRTRGVLSVDLNDASVDRFIVPARYAPEFNAIGLNHPALRALATRTGGQVIDPTQTSPIDFPWPSRATPLAPWLAILSALCACAACVVWRRGE